MHVKIVELQILHPKVHTYTNMTCETYLEGDTIHISNRIRVTLLTIHISCDSTKSGTILCK